MLESNRNSLDKKENNDININKEFSITSISL